jgi:phosphatidylglycerophosphate synthase
MTIPAKELDPVWTRAHAVLLLGLCVASYAARHPLPLAAGALLSFAIFCGGNLGVWRSRRALPNAITLFRLLLSCVMITVLHGQRVPVAVALVAAWAMDGLDGLLARRLGAESEFGAHLDAEVDAFLVLAAGAELWLTGQLGAWALIGGLLRYVYVLCVAVFPSRKGLLPRSRFARYAFGVVVLALALALVLPKPFDAIAAALGTAWIGVSFVRSFWWLYGKGAASAH